LLQKAALADPGNPTVPLNLSFVFRALGDTAREMAALTRALTIDPYFLPALLRAPPCWNVPGNHPPYARRRRFTRMC